MWENENDNDFESVGILQGHVGDVKYIKWHPTRNQLFSCSYDNLMKSWVYDHENADDWINNFTMTAHESTVWCKLLFINSLLECDFDRTGNYLCSVGDDKNMMVWAISEDNCLNKGIVTKDHGRAIYSCSWSKGSI